ncbi:MAG: DUF1998 domain-containing protein [Rhodobacteraceae bacterium]|nr:DUF1998 domain-containing protein [Paracoccaceae bacterium]
MHSTNESIQQLHRALSEYIEATYHISAPSLIRQRKALLGVPGLIYQIPYLESTPRYLSGETIAGMAGLPEAALQVYMAISREDGELPRLIFDPPYKHQSDAIRGCLIEGRNLVIMTGTGSGKTESFLWPILGKLAVEANRKPKSFNEFPSMRALVLYPMNALVNDQLGRLRGLFADPRIVEQFKSWYARPPRFARYTSRTPYAGMRNPDKDGRKLKAFDDFYVGIECKTRSIDQDERDKAKRLLNELKEHGKWPAKPDLSAWLGNKGSRWKNPKTGEFQRAVTLPEDSELITRHEVQVAPPDLLVTNYSMLEYMLMRPIERPIFDATRQWLEENPEERFLVVLDEAHLYRGAGGAEVGLLIRRLRDRLDISEDRMQVICATASFQDSEYAPEFGAQLSGLPSDSFVAITGTLALKKGAAVGTEQEAKMLAAVNLERFYKANSDPERLDAVQELLKYRGVSSGDTAERVLHGAFCDYGPMKLLINATMKEAKPLGELGAAVFPEAPKDLADAALNTLMALGSVAREKPNTPGLLPCRIHNFFRGLPGLWVCMDPQCSELEPGTDNPFCGKMYGQPREFCSCGARVLELYTCRNCGSAYARAYTDNVFEPKVLWAEPGERLRMATTDAEPVSAIDLLLEEPSNEEYVELANYDLETGRLNPRVQGERMRNVFLRGERMPDAVEEGYEAVSDGGSCGQFVKCAVCKGTARFGRSHVQDHQTKGDQPFQALVSRQIQVQPPAPVKATSFAPLQGRKVLTFADSRQVAARLAPNLQLYSDRDALRPLIAWGYRRLQELPAFADLLCLDDLYLAVLLASKKLQVRLRPEIKSGESFAVDAMVADAFEQGVLENDEDLPKLCIKLRNERPPEALLDNIVTTIRDRFLGFEALALAALVERQELSASLVKLPSIPGVIESDEAKVGLARAWLRCWQRHGFWLNHMPPVWWKRPKSQGVSVGGQTGKFKAMATVLGSKEGEKSFWKQWSPKLLNLFAEEVEGDFMRLRGNQLSLQFDGPWVHCTSCKSVHRPVPGLGHCLDCGRSSVRDMDPNADLVFLARKGFYRKAVTEALEDPPRQPMALIAAEHTAQLNAPQNEDVFSKAEENELLFQDIELDTEDGRHTAIDVLSSTTTMEVGIDIGALSGVALRNMPPGRANYQQRSGRAGRRGNAVATVIAFGSSDSHDEHYFSKPDGMIRGDVVDPRLTLDNADLVRRHIRAFLLQNYHQERIPEINPEIRHDLFSVLGTVSEFRTGTGVLNRDDFAKWLEENAVELQERVDSWIPNELSDGDRAALIEEMTKDCLSAIDGAIGRNEIDDFSVEEEGAEENTEAEVAPEEGEERAQQSWMSGKLLDRLLYFGVLPRYAFPTDVATFHVFDSGRSKSFRPIMRFAPSQGLPVALSQYAPGKHVWISGKCYTSGAIYSPFQDERMDAWSAKRIYMECRECGFARTFETTERDRGEIHDCEACGAEGRFGPGRYWLRPPGFAHPVDLHEVTSPVDMPETSYATRAKLTTGTPDERAGWKKINDRAWVLADRQHLLVSNSGPRHDGYTYCTNCGRIESTHEHEPKLNGSHRKPYPADDEKIICEGVSPSRRIVLGTDFITDIALFLFRVASPLNLRPSHSPTKVALRTVSEALSKAACKLLQIEGGEVMAEFRPALTPAGKMGSEAEIFLYDTLAGGAGFSRLAADFGQALLEEALTALKSCEEGCDASCYRCLRSYKNKFEHSLLDRHVGAELLDYLVSGQMPKFDQERLRKSTTLLYHDLLRQGMEGVKLKRNVNLDQEKAGLVAPILIWRNDGEEFMVALSGPLTPNCAADGVVEEYRRTSGHISVILENELMVRGNLPAVTSVIRQKIGA